MIVAIYARKSTEQHVTDAVIFSASFGRPSRRHQLAASLNARRSARTRTPCTRGIVSLQSAPDAVPTTLIYRGEC